MPRKALTGGGTRGRSRSRGSSGGGAKRQGFSSSRSLSRVSFASNDGFSRRGWSRPQGYSMYHDPFPRIMRAVLRYSETISLDAVVGFPATHVFRAGSIHDPNLTGTGHQPYGHDTYQGIFNHYRVIKSTCKITNTSNGGQNIMALSLHDDTTLTTDYDLIREMKPSKFLPLGQATDIKSLCMTYNSEQTFPGQDRGTTALFGNNPNEDMYYHISSEGSSTVSDPAALSIVVCIEYFCEFTELKNLGIS